MRFVGVSFQDVVVFEPLKHSMQCILLKDDGPCSNHPIWVISQSTNGPLPIEAWNGKLIPYIEHSKIAWTNVQNVPTRPIEYFD
jgi:hypothetical protein